MRMFSTKSLFRMGIFFWREMGLPMAFMMVKNLHERLFGHSPAEKYMEGKLKCHAVKVNFVGGNAQEVISFDPYSEIRNYYLGNDQSKWASGVKSYNQVRYSQLYDGIDLLVYAEARGLKYDFTVAPGADPYQIMINYDGAKKIWIEDEELHIKTSVGEMVEKAPFAYQVINDQRVKIPCFYKLRGNNLTFEFPKDYNRDLPLIIDPSLVFSTFTGSYGDNFGFTATYDDAGNLYAGGIALATGYPVTSGAYDVTFAGGGADIAISKFNPAGTSLLYATYIGGSGGYDQPHSLVVNSDDELLIMGRTNASDFPTTVGAYDRTHNGNYDIIVCKLSPDGTSLLASTFVGGTADDGLNMTASYMRSDIKYNYGDDSRGEVIVDANDNVFVAACTQSNNFPATPGCFQPVIGSAQDGCVFRMSPDLSNLTWASFLGGSGNDAAYGIALNSSGLPYVSGGTSSSDFPTTAGTLHPTARGGIDGFYYAYQYCRYYSVSLYIYRDN